MLVLDYPAGAIYAPERFEFGVRGGAVINESMTTGSLAISPAASARFISTLAFNNRSIEEQAARESLFVRISGQRNLVTMWHLMRPAPRGSLRGNPTTAALVAKNATTATLNCQSGETLNAGDMLRIGQQTVMITADAVASGTTIAIAFECAMREQVNSGTAVVWDRPRIQWLQSGPEVYIPYSPGFGGQFTVSFVEAY